MQTERSELYFNIRCVQLLQFITFGMIFFKSFQDQYSASLCSCHLLQKNADNEFYSCFIATKFKDRALNFSMETSELFNFT